MPMMNVRKMRVAMSNRDVLMYVAMGRTCGYVFVVIMLVMCIVAMTVRVLHRLMLMIMAMSLSQVQPNARDHEQCSYPKGHRH